MRMMRVLFLSPIGHIGGAERVLLTAIAGMKRECPAAAVRVLALADGPLAAAVRASSAECEVIPLPPRLADVGDSRLGHGRVGLALRTLSQLPVLASYLRQLRAAVVRYGPTLVHSNGIKTHLLSRFTISARVPVVWHLHDFPGSRPAAGWLLRRSSGRVRAAIAVSNAVAADARGALSGTRIEVVPNAIDLTQFAPGSGDGGDLDRRAGMSPAPGGTVRVGLVATYAPWKGHLLVLDAAACLSAESPDLPIRWYIVGGPIYQTAAQWSETELRTAAATRGLANRVGFVPFVLDPAPVYRSLDVVLHASTNPEPFGLTVAEAMACGRAVVVSKSGGVTELFTDGVDAIGVEPGNVGEVAAAIRRLVDDAELRRALGRQARRTAEERFDANHYGRRLMAVYRSFLPGEA
jgi:glycosyltransferase involved in cell wall biosynthesis